LSVDEFVALVETVLGRERRPNAAQRDCLAHDPVCPLLIVAGPGTGKTTVLVLRALRHMLVDRIAPEQIMITTFTRKAAKEIRTRLIEWGTPLLDHLLSGAAGVLQSDYASFLRDLDINRFVTGTLDSICEDALSSAREPNERPLIVVETFAANQMLARRGGVYDEAQQVGQTLKDYLARYTLTGDPPVNVGEMTRIVRTIVDRLVQDDVDVSGYLAAGDDLAPRQALARIFDRYSAHLAGRNQMDFPALERAFLERILSARMPGTVAAIRVLLVDEYQDTNPLQERIYLELALATRASLTIVGDDDQSLYRFRGATIELFRDFAARATITLGGPKTRGSKPRAIATQHAS
jgi:DNA helicase II / ATP-dependent DNA helicase PcrA